MRQRQKKQSKQAGAIGLAIMLSMGLSLVGEDRALADSECRNPNLGANYQSASQCALARWRPHGTAFDVSLNGKVLYSTSPPQTRLELGRAFVSNDAQTVVWILNDRFSCNIHPGPQPIDAVDLNAPALICFFKGKLVKSFTLAELLLRTNMLSASASHVQWIPEKRDGNWKFSPTVVFKDDGSSLEFETTSMRRYVIDPRTGTVLTAEDTSIWKDADAIVYGQLAGGRGRLQLKQAKALKGTASALEKATIFDPTASYDAGWHTIAVKKILGAWTTIAPDYKVPVIYNIQ
jgi:hypothetical protein